MLRHGGGYEYRPMDPRITHTVAANLADTKAIALAKAKSSFIFVRPEWVTCSVAAGRLLPVASFLLRPPGMNLPGQRQLFAAATGAGAAGPGFSLNRADPDRGAAARSRTATATARAVWPAAAAASVPAPVAPAPTTSPSSAAEALAAARKARAACDLLRGPPKSTADRLDGDASAGGEGDFVGGFYRASRLHFIGSWRTRFEALATRLQLEDDTAGKNRSDEFGKHPVAAAFAPPPPAAKKGNQTDGNRFVIHLDMDCFFASVSLSKTPAYRGHPLVVCHSSGEGTRKGNVKERNQTTTEEEEEQLDDDFFAGGEVACPCYLARSFGIRAGMGVVAAKRLCPALIAVPYDFASYERASEEMYRVLLRCGRRVQPLSVDEALIDASGLNAEQAGALASALRRAVFEATGGCAASCGVGPNPLLARLATRQAKPDGLRVLASFAEADSLLLSLPCDALPGVGWSSRSRLEAAGLRTVAEIRAAGKEALAAALTGVFTTTSNNNSGNPNSSNSSNSLNATVQSLWEAAHGRDPRSVVPLQPRRSVGAECNWGVRFREASSGGHADAADFLRRLSLDLSGRLRAAGALPGALTIKLKVRRAGAGAPRKHLGHGVCDAFSRTTAMTITSSSFSSSKPSSSSTSSSDDGFSALLASRLAAVGRGLLQSLNPKPEDIRGMGLVASKLVAVAGAAKMMTKAAAAGSGAAAPTFVPVLGSAEKRWKRQTDLNALLVPRRPGEASLSPPGGGAAVTTTRSRSNAATANATTTRTTTPTPPPPTTTPQRRPQPPSSVPPPCEGWTFDSDSDSDSDLTSSSSSSSSSDDEDESESSDSEESDSDGEEKISSSASEALSDVVALSQVDASVFDALPLRLQRELLAGLPESREEERRLRRRRKRKKKEEKKKDAGEENAAPKRKKDRKKKEKKKRRRRKSAIVPLPRPEELDREVLDALPLPLRWEIERAMREEGERGMNKKGEKRESAPLQLRQARLDKSGFLSPPSEKKKGSSSSASLRRRARPPSSRTATPSPSPAAADRGKRGWTTPVSAARRRRRLVDSAAAAAAAAPPLSAVAEGEEESDKEEDSEAEADLDFGGFSIVAAVLSSAATEEGDAAAPAFDVAAEWARGALGPERKDAEGALRVARALFKVSNSNSSSSSSSAAASARKSLLTIQEAALECFGAPLLLETRSERLSRRKEEEEEKKRKEEGRGAASTVASLPLQR